MAEIQYQQEMVEVIPESLEEINGLLIHPSI